MVFSEIQHKYLNACLVGDIKTVARMIKIENKKVKTTTMLMECLYRTCEGGYYDIFLLITQYKPTIINSRTLYYACKGGNMKIVNKLTENFEDFDSFSNSEYSLQNYGFGSINGYRSREDLWSNAMYGACEGGKLDIFSLCMNHVRLHQGLLFSCFYMACKSGNIDLVHFITNRKVFNGHFWASDYNPHHSISNACASGSLEIIRLLMDKNTDDISDWCDWREGLKKACEHGHVEIVKLMIARGATNFNECLFNACISENIEIVNILIDNGATNWDKGLQGACYIGNMNLAKIMLQKGASDLNKGLQSACSKGHFKIINLMIARGATNITEGFNCACKFGRLDLVKLYIQNGVINLNEGLYEACTEGYINITRFLIKCGAADLETCLEDSENIDIINLLIKEGASPNSLKNTNYFRPYLLYCNFTKIAPNIKKYLTLLAEYQPYILFIKSRHDSLCPVHKLPTDLFGLLVHYI